MLEKNKKNGIKVLGLVFLFTFFSIALSCFGKVNALDNDYCFQFDMDLNGFPVSKVLINGEDWDKNSQYHSNENKFTIVVYAGKKVLEGNEYPTISTAGGLDDYKKYYSSENPNEDPNVEGDEYILTLIIHDYDDGNTCTFMGYTLQNGPLEPYSEIAEADISITIIGSELEYHYVEDKPDEADVSFFKFGINSGISDDIVPFTFGNANYTTNSNEPPKNVDRVTTKQAIHYEYTYDGSGYVTFYINGSGAEFYKSIVINNVDYSDQVPTTQVQVFEHLNAENALIFEIHDVVYNEDGYNVVVTGELYDESCTTAGFGWSYLSSDRSEDVTPENEGAFAHGRLEFVQAKYTDIDNVDHVFNNVTDYNNGRYHETGEIYSWFDGRKDYIEEDRRTAWGSARVPYGTELTVRVVPDEGYQLVSFSTSPTGFQATDEVGVYKIVLTRDNFSYNSENRSFDLSPVFALVDDENVNSSNTVTDVSIQHNASAENGTFKFEVKDIADVGDSAQSFNETAEYGGYTVSNYLDLSLYNTIYQGGKKDNNNNYLSWDTEVENLNGNATVTLAFNDDLDGKDIIVIHEVHDGNQIMGYDVIEPTYNSANNTISFETDSFSKFAVATKGGNTENPDDPNEPEQPKETHTITFNTTGGSEVQPVDVEDGNNLELPDDPTREGFVFKGWFYDENCEDPFDFNMEIHESFTVFARWENAPEKYVVESDDDNFKLEFTVEGGHTYRLEMIDFANLSAEEIEILGLSQEEYDEGKAMYEEATKEFGKLIALYNIDVCDEDDRCIHDETTITIKIKMTDAMKGFNTFKLVYVDDDMSTEDPIILTVQDGYLVGVLPHLSAYALNASYVSNPKTLDSLPIWIMMLGISFVGLSLATRKKKYCK